MKTAQVALAAATAGLVGSSLAFQAAGWHDAAVVLVALSFGCALAGFAVRLAQEIRAPRDTP